MTRERDAGQTSPERPLEIGQGLIPLVHFAWFDLTNKGEVDDLMLAVLLPSDKSTAHLVRFQSRLKICSNTD
jgi:hypothetical protein